MSLKILLCDKCEGWGKITKDQVIDYHKNEQDYWEEKCDKCDGHGRLREVSNFLYVELLKKKGQTSEDTISSQTITVSKLRKSDLSIKGREK